MDYQESLVTFQDRFLRLSRRLLLEFIYWAPTEILWTAVIGQTISLLRIIRNKMVANSTGSPSSLKRIFALIISLSWTCCRTESIFGKRIRRYLSGVRNIEFDSDRKSNSVHNKVAIVTGAGSGIGRSTSLRLINLGWKIIGCDINSDGLDETLRATTSKSANSSGTFMKFRMDVSREEDRNGLLSFLEENGIKAVNALVNCAGITSTGPVIGEINSKTDTLLQVNAIGLLKLVRLLFPVLIRGKATILAVSSTTGSSAGAWPWTGTYSATKAYVEGYSTCLRREILAANLPMNVVIVAPGAVSTPLVQGLYKQQSQWADENRATSSFANALENSARTQKNAENIIGMSNPLFFVSPEKVASIITEAVSATDPLEKYVVCAPIFSILKLLLDNLPAFLGDELSTNF